MLQNFEPGLRLQVGCSLPISGHLKNSQHRTWSPNQSRPISTGISCINIDLSSDGWQRKEIETESKIPSLELGQFWQRVILIGCLPMSQSAGVVSLDPRQNVNQEVCLIFPNFLKGPKISPKALYWVCVGNLNRFFTRCLMMIVEIEASEPLWQWKCWRLKSWYSRTLKTDR